jgi:hypothetical protein
VHPGHMPRHTRLVFPLRDGRPVVAGAVIVMSEVTQFPAPRLGAAHGYPSQNARMASCSLCTLEKPKAAAAAARPPNFFASAETLVP